MVVMRKALAECRSWRDMGLDLSVAVNLSARNLLDLHLVDDVAAVIDEAGVPAGSLTLELTESMVMSDSQRSVDVLSGLAELGVRLSCDDFGTGYSSLAHLRRLPICEIKIDKSFIARMAVDESDRAIARSVLALGRDLGLVTVAEGVESREGWDLLTALGCDMAQGFVVCPPLTSPQFGAWLDRRQPEEFAYLEQAAPTAGAEHGDHDVVIELRDTPTPTATASSGAAGGRGPGAGDEAQDREAEDREAEDPAVGQNGRAGGAVTEAPRAAGANGHGPGDGSGNGSGTGSGQAHAAGANGKGTPGAGNGAGARPDGSTAHAVERDGEGDEAEATATDEPG
jgi:EAL domain-containing protein (putative c-di-GMP-specific phosphodiesterase class I)